METFKILIIGDSTIDLVIEFEGGEVVFLANNNQKIFHNSFELISEKGRIFGLNGGREVSWNNAITDKMYKGYTILNNHPKIFEEQFSDHLRYVPREIERFFKSNNTNLTSLGKGFLMEKFLSELEKGSNLE